MKLTRRDFLKASSAVAAALGVTTIGLPRTRRAEALTGAPPVVWLQGQGCTGCSVSLLNTIYYMTIDTLLLNTVDLKFHTTVMAAAGGMATSAAEAARAAKGYVLVIEGAIPTGEAGKFCTLWPGMTMQQAVINYAANAGYILAVGSCAAYGGMPAGAPNPTGAKPVSAIVTGKPVINIPGCAAHPDWIVGTVAYILANGRAPSLDSSGRPRDYFGGDVIHEECPRHDYYERGQFAATLGSPYCLYRLGCKGPRTHCDCDRRRWNGGAAATPGVNWCMGANSPCIGCTEATFPDSMSPFFTLDGTGGGGGGTTTTRRNTTTTQGRSTTTTRPNTTTTQGRSTTTTRRNTTTTQGRSTTTTQRRSTSTTRRPSTTTTTLRRRRRGEGESDD